MRRRELGLWALAGQALVARGGGDSGTGCVTRVSSTETSGAEPASEPAAGTWPPSPDAGAAGTSGSTLAPQWVQNLTPSSSCAPHRVQYMETSPSGACHDSHAALPSVTSLPDN